MLLPLSGAKDKCGNIWRSALKFRHLQKITAPGGLALGFGHLGKGLHGSCGGGGTCPPNLLAFPEHLAKGDAEEVMHLDF